MYTFYSQLFFVVDIINPSIVVYREIELRLEVEDQITHYSVQVRYINMFLISGGS